MKIKKIRILNCVHLISFFKNVFVFSYDVEYQQFYMEKMRLKVSSLNNC